MPVRPCSSLYWEYAVNFVAKDEHQVEKIMEIAEGLRGILEAYLGTKYDLKEYFEFYERRYRFTRLLQYPKANTRACIGFIFDILKYPACLVTSIMMAMCYLGCRRRNENEV